MALGAAIFKAKVNLSNFNTNYYDDLNLTMAKHPSESEGRMMYRLLAYLFCAHENLEFTRGLSSTEEPELWQKGYGGEIIQWIELGLPDEKRIRQACGKSLAVKVFTYQGQQALDWYQKIKGKFIGNSKLSVYHFEIIENGPIEKLVSRSMQLSCIIEESFMYLGDDDQRIGIKVSKEH